MGCPSLLSGDLSAPSLLFPLKTEAGETFSVLCENIFSPSCFPSEIKLGKVSLSKWELCQYIEADLSCLIHHMPC